MMEFKYICATVARAYFWVVIRDLIVLKLTRYSVDTLALVVDRQEGEEKCASKGNASAKIQLGAERVSMQPRRRLHHDYYYSPRLLHFVLCLCSLRQPSTAVPKLGVRRFPRSCRVSKRHHWPFRELD